MKPYRFLLALFIAVCFYGLNHSIAQTFIPKGALIGGGAFSFSSQGEKFESGSSTTEHTLTSLGFTPQATYFVMDNLGIGAALSVSSDKEKDKDSDGMNSFTQIAFGPVVRYYFAEGPFAQAMFGFGSQKSKFESGSVTGESTSSLTMWEAGAGYSVRISDTILLDPMVGYGSTNAKNKDSDATLKQSGLFIRLGFTLILISK